MPIPELDLAEFIAKYGKPYDPTTDMYRRPPFASPIKSKMNSIDDVHSYHTRIPPQGIEPYIQHYTNPGDLVLDPFCGSGTTGIASIRQGRRVILNDLSPAAVHIARNYCLPVDVKQLKLAFESMMATSVEEFNWLYGTTCDRCGGQAEIQYTIWSDVFECARCGYELILWDLAVDERANEIRDFFNCPSCHKSWNKSELRRLRAIPVVTNYECARCKPSRSEHATTRAEINRLAEIAAEKNPYWHPEIVFDQSFEMWRRVHADLNVTDSSKFFTPRNLWAFSRLWHETNAVPQEVGDRLKFTLTGSVPSLTVMTIYMPDRSGRGNRKGTLYIPSLSIEQNVAQVVKRRFNRVVKYAEQLHQSDVFVRVGTAGSMPEISTSSIDYVFTDPPFGSNIFYADVNFIWESWLGLQTDQSQEAVVHIKHKDKNTLPDYARLITNAFREIHRVLKPGRWASVVFHNSDDKIWQTILDAAQSAEFELAEINSFDKSHLSFKGIKGSQGLERVTNKDIVLNLHKSSPSVRGVANVGPVARNTDAEVRVVQRIADFLATNPGSNDRTLQHFWNVVLHDMLVNGVVEVSMEQVGNMLPYYFKDVDGHWYLRGEAVMGGNAFDLKTDAGAIAWLSAVLTTPRTVGELIPQWQAETAQVSDADAGRLERLLEQNYWQDKKTGRWRQPTNEEREKMTATEDIAAEAHLRVIHRFLAGQSDHQPSNRELAEWVRFAYNHQAPADAVALYTHVDESKLEPEFVKELRKIVSVCRMKVGQAGKV